MPIGAWDQKPFQNVDKLNNFNSLVCLNKGAHDIDI